MTRVAAIDCGTNSIRLLVADGHIGEDGRPHLADLTRQMRIVRLGKGVDARGYLDPGAISRTVEATIEYQRMIEKLGATRTRFVATSATRDASNSAEFIRQIKAVIGVEPEVIVGTEEASLSFRGAVGGLGGSVRTPMLVVDIGGGSTEFTLGDDARIIGAVSLQMGAVRMNAQNPIFSKEAYDATVLQCRRLIRRDAPMLLAAEKRDYWVGVGGTMTTLGAMERAIPLFDPETCDGMTISLERVAAWGERLARISVAERGQIIGLMAHRADIIPSGVAILEAAMREFGIKTLKLSAHGNMDGYLKKKFQKRY